MDQHRILFVGKNHLPYIGGSEISTHHLATMLAARGHSVTVLTRLARRSVPGLIDEAIRGVTRQARLHPDGSLGYVTIRCVRPVEALRTVMEAIRPDVVVVTCGDPAFATEVLRGSASTTSVLYVRDGGSAVAAGAPHVDLVVANSRYVADAVRRAGRGAAFLPSLFPRSDYEATTSREKVLFVNPTPRKGLDMALFLAGARPDIPFVFSLSWRMRGSLLRSIRRTARRLGNVEIRPATTDPQALFRDCRIVLVPTQVPEAWCRVVSEAQINGIPGLASRVGGLPESVGPGGMLVHPPDSREAWLEALAALWDDDATYGRLSGRALQHSRRPELSPELVVRQFESLLAGSIAMHEACG